MEDKESYKAERRVKDSDDRKTVGAVMDKKTKEILDKLKKQGVLKEISGTVSEGKEASIYVGVASSEIYSKMCIKEENKKDNENNEDINVVIKIYKTSTMLFKDRERYIIGERRFKRYSKGNSRKLVKIWAEKEVRNLNRIRKNGIPAPLPLFIRRNILIMTKIGSTNISNININSTNNSNDNDNGDGSTNNDNGDGSTNNDNDNGSTNNSNSNGSTNSNGGGSGSGYVMGLAPNLKSAKLTGDTLEDAYDQTVSIMCEMYWKCGLVHADLSEYNLLYWENTVYVIDVSQSVERDHVNAQEFLEMDVRNINGFFSRAGASTYSNSELIKRITEDYEILPKIEEDGSASESIEEESNSSEESSSSCEEGSNSSEKDSNSSGEDSSSCEEDTDSEHNIDGSTGIYNKMNCQDSEEEKKNKKMLKKQRKEENREKRKDKVPKKEKKKLSRKARISKKK
ncbi:RIO kinase 1 [Nematocida sp. LUAm3]|nr:RIO kinase 1 [Nematocida sp. LUAm3]KAI5176255.1 RIO kinase 1 [Nematocida sp. LUAm2]KAI5176713.1 RIO kinase 1 [Nematocida sp. LUAm1]